MPVLVPTSAHTSEYQQVAVSDLDTRYSLLRLADPKAMSSLSNSLQRHGMLQPLTVNRDGESLVVLDGFKRLLALSEGADQTVPVRIVVLEPAQAKAALVTFNRAHRGVSELEEAWVVKSLVTEHGMSQKDVAELLGRHKSWVCRRLQLVERLDASVVEDMRLGLVSATMARELVRLPRGNQVRAAAAIHQHGLSSRQTVDLVNRLLHAADEAEVQELLDDPMRFLASPDANKIKSRDPRLSDDGGKLYTSIYALTRQARTTNAVIRSPSVGLAVSADLAVLRPQIFEAIQALDMVLMHLNQFALVPGADA